MPYFALFLLPLPISNASLAIVVSYATNGPGSECDHDMFLGDSNFSTFHLALGPTAAVALDLQKGRLELCFFSPFQLEIFGAPP